MFLTCAAIWSFLSGQGESRYPSPILPKSAIVLGAKEQDLCQDEAKFVFQHGNVKISYEGVASACSWQIPQISQTKFSVMVYQMDKVKLSKSTSECNGLLKFPGQGFRCNMNVGDCFIYTTEENTCDATDIVRTMKEKLQCAESVIRKTSKEDMLLLSFSNNHKNTYQTSFEITSSYHDIECDMTNQSSPGHITHPGNNNTAIETTNSTDLGYTYTDNGTILGSSRMVGFLMLTTLPVIIAIVGITVYTIRRNRTNPQKKATSPGQISEVTHESIVARGLELNEYVQTEYIVEYEMNPRNSFISFPDSENQSDVVPYTYKNETVIPEKNGYLIPTTNDDGYIPPPDEETSTRSEVRYAVPPEDTNEASIYNDDPFEDGENPYEVVRDVYYRSESYSEN